MPIGTSNADEGPIEESAAKQLAKHLYEQVLAGISIHDVDENSASLEALLGYLIANLEEPNVDHRLLMVMARIFRIDIRKVRQFMFREKRDLEVSQEEKRTLMRFIIYEAYKVLNPNRLAGETEVENFISNVAIRGMKTACMYAKNNQELRGFVEKIYGPSFLKRLEKNKKFLIEDVRSHGFFGGGVIR